MRESDAFDDDTDHWGVVDVNGDQDDPPRYDCAWWFFSRLLLILVVVLFIVWSGVLRYG
jgi:hypothetical protein